MLEQKEVEFGGNKYLITQFPASRGVRLSKQVAKIAAPVLSSLYSEDGSYIKAVEAFLLSIDDVDFENLAKELITSVTNQSMAINFDQEFAGKYDLLINLMLEVVKFNFESVFTLLGS